MAAKIAAVKDTDQERSETIVPASTEEKNKAEDEMINEAVKTARVISVYSFDTGNEALQMQMNQTKSKFYSLQDNQKLTRAKTILSKAQEYATELLNYGLDQAKIDSLTNSVNTYESLIIKPRETINERKGKTNALKQLFAEGKSLINDRLDKLMSLFKDSEKEFYSAYFSARNVINTAYRKSPEK